MAHIVARHAKSRQKLWQTGHFPTGKTYGRLLHNDSAVAYPERKNQAIPWAYLTRQYATVKPKVNAISVAGYRQALVPLVAWEKARKLAAHVGKKMGHAFKKSQAVLLFRTYKTGIKRRNALFLTFRKRETVGNFVWTCMTTGCAHARTPGAHRSVINYGVVFIRQKSPSGCEQFLSGIIYFIYPAALGHALANCFGVKNSRTRNTTLGAFPALAEPWQAFIPPCSFYF